MPAPPVNPGPRVRCLIAIADTSLSAFEKLRLSEEAIAARPPRANLPYVRALARLSQLDLGFGNFVPARCR
jgi:hypothetical protein